MNVLTVQILPLFATTMRLYDRGTEVEALQTALKKEGVFSVDVTGYYGPITEASVSAFQEKYRQEVLAMWNLTKGTGYAGVSTLKQLNKFYGCVQ